MIGLERKLLEGGARIKTSDWMNILLREREETTMNMPQFTAEASLNQTRGRYRVTALTTAVVGRGATEPALQIRGEPDWVDCNEPFAYLCQECGGTGPGSIRCCRNDYCAVIDRRFQGGGVFRF